MPKRAEWYAHIQHTGSQYHLSAPLGRIAKPQNRRGLLERFEHACVQQTMAGDLALVDFDEPLLAEWERSLEKTAHSHEPVSLALVRTIPGVGQLLALVLRYDIEDIARFPRVQACVSSCRLVKRARASHGKRHGPSGKKSENAHLKWAFSEAAGLFRKHNPSAPKYLATRATKHGTGTALALLAPQLGRAVSCMLKHHGACDQAKCLATQGWRERTHLASHWRHRGKRHTPAAPNRALRRVGHEPAPAVPVPTGTPGILWRCLAVRSAPRSLSHAHTRLADGAAPSPSPELTGRPAGRPSQLP
jgi:hypothetical protein